MLAIGLSTSEKFESPWGLGLGCSVGSQVAKTRVGQSLEVSRLCEVEHYLRK